MTRRARASDDTPDAGGGCACIEGSPCDDASACEFDDGRASGGGATIDCRPESVGAGIDPDRGTGGGGGGGANGTAVFGVTGSRVNAGGGGGG